MEYLRPAPSPFAAMMMPDPVEIPPLRYSRAFANAGGFSRAADDLGISQPSISQPMREIEPRWRVMLFPRRGKPILPTPTGAIFQEHVRSLHRQFKTFLRELNTLPGQLRDAFHLGVGPIVDTPYVPFLLGLLPFTRPSLQRPLQR